MLRLNLITAIRNLRKNKLTSSISITGLVLAMTSTLLIVQYVYFESNFDNFHDNPERIFRVNMNLVSNNDAKTSAGTFFGLGEQAKAQFPEIKNYFTSSFNSAEYGQLQYEKNGVRESGRVDFVHYIEPAVFKILKFETIEGSISSALEGTKGAVISRSLAQRLFRSVSVIGKSIYWNETLFEITAVIEDQPENAHLEFELMLPMADMQRVYPEYRENIWTWYGYYTYYLLEEGVNIEELEDKIDKLVVERKDQKSKGTDISLQQIEEIHWESNIRYEPSTNTSKSSIVLLCLIALLIIIIAYINYINLFSTTYLRRAKEIGIRKVMGSTKKLLVSQLIIESILINIIASIPALIIVYLLSTNLPNYIESFPSFDLFNSIYFWLLGIISVLCLGIFSGIYPALLISNQAIVDILKGVFIKHGKGAVVRKVLITTQFVIASALILFTIVVNKQLHYMLEEDLGVNISRTLVLKAPLEDSENTNALSTFRNELLENPAVSNVSSSNSIPGVDMPGRSIRLLSNSEETFVISYIDVDENYMGTFDIPLVAGRGFSSDNRKDEGSVIINEKVADLLGVSPENMINREVLVSGDTATVIGVMRNYYHKSLHEGYQPIVMDLNGDHTYVSIGLNTTNLPNAISEVEDQWQLHFKSSLFDYFFADERFNKQYNKEQELSAMINAFSIIAILIACLGLFAFTLFAMINRRKEVGIRKVLGAPNINLFWNLSKSTFGLIIVSSLIALPLSYYLSDLWLSKFANRTNIEWYILLVPVIVLFLFSLFTISYNMIRTILVNPSEILSQE